MTINQDVRRKKKKKNFSEMIKKFSSKSKCRFNYPFMSLKCIRGTGTEYVSIGIIVVVGGLTMQSILTTWM